MIPSITPQKLRFTAFSGLMGLLLVSCGSYEQASYYDDGIYSGGTERVAVTESRNPQPAAQQGGDDFYQNYFGEKSQELDRYLESEVFTDVDAYTSAQARDSLAADSLGVAMGNYYQDYNNDYAGQPGWGDSASNVSINIYGGMGWNNWAWGFPMYDWYWGGLYSPWYWNNWGWGVGWGWGYPGWGWGAGWGWGYPGWGWGYPGWGWGYPGWGWGYPYYRYAGYAYGRRGYYGRYNNINALGARSVMAANTRSVRTNSGRSNRDYSSSRYASARSNQNRNAVARNTAYRSSRSSRSAARYGTSSRSSRTYTGISRSSRQRAYQNSSSQTRRPGTYSSGRSGSSRNIYSRTGRTYQNSGSSRVYGPSSRSSGSYRSSGSRSSGRSSGSYRSSGGSRSSGSIRSSGGGVRSSGGRSSGGRSSGGRSGGRGGQR